MPNKRRTQMAVAAVVVVGLVASVQLTPSGIALAGGRLQQPQVVATGFGAGAYRQGAGIVNPVIVKIVTPKYTQDAMRRKISGNVEVEVVVLTDGTVGDLRITHSLDQETGLDDQSVRAARQWTFKPATLNGEPVPCVVRLVMEFRMAPTTKAEGTTGAYVPQPLDDNFARGAFWHGEQGVTAPVVVRQVEPKYTANAMRAKVEGSVSLEVIVTPNGTVGATRIVRSLDTLTGLDDQATLAVKQWMFKPGLLNGVAVPVVVTVEVDFRLH